MPSRRSVLTGAITLASAAIGAPKQSGKENGGAGAFLDLLRTPDYAAAYASDKLIPLSRSGNSHSASGISVHTEPTSTGLPIAVSAPGIEPTRIHLRWKAQISGDPLILGDAWERSYGELAWRSIVPDRVMPWYFLTYDRGALHGYGVKTQAAALCFWQLDSEGVSLWLDVSNGGSGVQLGDRELQAATIITRQGSRNEKPMEAATAFCRALCPNPRLPRSPLYGSNDWYYAYGKNSADQTLRDADLVATLSQSNKVRPFTVIDMGWQDGSATFPSMSGLASQIKEKQVRPGLWIRPLEAPADVAANLLLSSDRFGKLAERKRELAFDPTIPEALSLVTQKVKSPVNWGYELIKHDFSTYDLLGKWGREMGPEPTVAGWHLHDRTRTNAEVILALYRALREAAGENTLLIGCNTVGHIGAGIFEAQRTGDDTSGKVWERTRRMGVNTLAYRLAQHNTFFAADPDCVGITSAIPWDLNRQWLDLIANTGVALFISPGPDATGEEQRTAIKEAFALTASQRAKAVPENWFRDVTPESWVVSGKRKRYSWYDNSGCLPFEI
jgi:alpha-galactosidase